MNQSISKSTHKVNLSKAEQAKIVGLTYISSDNLGHTRKACGRGFKFLTHKGQLITGELRDNIAKLPIPPAWRDVWISPDLDGHLLATGYDKKGRKQYLYHPDWCALRQQKNFARMIPFAETLPTIRRLVETDFSQRTLNYRCLAAVAVRFLDDGLIRVGNRRYTQNNGSYGLTTLTRRHINVNTKSLTLEFLGKSGVERCIKISDARMARKIKKCHELPGQHLLQYLDETGCECALSSSDVNEYLSELSKDQFTAKDFRTWGGTVAAIEFVLSHQHDEEMKKEDINERSVVDYVAAKLGNTAAVARKNYIHPAIIKAIEQRKVPYEVPRTMIGQFDGLSEIEMITLSVLKEAIPS
ncbi:MAG: hypothetical protein P1U57_06185 [Oleibacter sp.]|nr:hypothetical protein [Thalassolituus sp.]